MQVAAVSQSRPRPRRGRAFRHGLGVVGVLTTLLYGCQWEPYIPKGPKTKVHVPRERTVPLTLGEPREHALDCPRGQCEVRFRVVLQRGGLLRVRIDAREQSDQMGLRVVLEDPIGRVLKTIPVSQDPPLELAQPVEYGPYQILVQAIGGRIPFQIRADLE